MAAETRQRRNVLVTGASSGIGADLARVCAGEGYDLVLVARSRDRLDELARGLREAHGVTARAFPADLSVPGASAALHARIAREGIEVDVLVNDAGFGMRGKFAELDAARQSAMIQVNVVALTELTRLFVPDMVRRGFGRVVNLSSNGAFQPCPGMAIYCASKAYVLSFSEALALELRGTGVTVTCVAPGATATRFAETAGTSRSRLVRAGAMPSREVAEATWAAAKRGTALLVPGFRNRLGAFSVRFGSIRMAARVAEKLMQDA